MGSEPPKPLDYRYRFSMPDGKVKEFKLRLDGATLRLESPPGGAMPEWTRLSHRQCPNCPLSEDRHPRCPVAVNLVEVIEFFKDLRSSEQVGVEIVSDARAYFKRVPIAVGISALIGITMVTSGCPILDKLKPMVRTHLPFATLEETLYRMVGMYMLLQHFRAKRGEEPDWELKGFLALVEDIRKVNKSFCERLYSVCRADSNLNALVHLDCFVDSSAFQIERKGLAGIEKLFDAYF